MHHYNMKLLTNNKGFAIIVIPLTLAIIGLVGAGVIVSVDYEKDLAEKRDIQRQEDIVVIQDKLNVYYSENQSYPSQKDEAFNSQDILNETLGEIPQDPLTSKGLAYLYWSDSQVYTLRYFMETTNEEVVVFSE